MGWTSAIEFSRQNADKNEGRRMEKRTVKKITGKRKFFQAVTPDWLKASPYIVEVPAPRLWESDEEQWGEFLRAKHLKSLTELLYERTLIEEEALGMMAELCRALEQCERKGFSHGDICPEYILITGEGRAKLGIFHMRGQTAVTQAHEAAVFEAETELSDSVEEAEVTVSDSSEEGPDRFVNIGAFTYRSPELYRGEASDGRADLYSLGMVFYRIMNRGREPFVSNEKQLAGYGDRKRALEKRMSGEALPSPADASPEFGRILKKACAFRREDRYRHAAGLRRKLEKCLQSGKCRLSAEDRIRRKRRKAIVVAALVFLLCMGGYRYWQQMPVQTVPERPDGFTGILRRDGTLTLEGEGTLEHTDSLAKWAYGDQVKTLIIHGKDSEIKEAFKSFHSLKKIDLSGVTVIGAYSFDRCRKLKEVSLPSGLKRIGCQAFSSCVLLESVRLPRGVETIESYAFLGCVKLNRIEIPKSVKSFGEGAFGSTAWMEAQSMKGGFLIVNDILLRYFGEEPEVALSEPMGIRSIAPTAFMGNETLKNVILTDSVEKIGENAFSDCYALESVVLPKGLKELPDRVFENCYSLAEIRLPDGLERIGEFAFADCKRLENICVPQSVTSIGGFAFLNTVWQNELAKTGEYIMVNGMLLWWSGTETELEIPESLDIRRVADKVFYGKDFLKSIVIPEGVISLGEGCFQNCTALEKIAFPKSLAEIGENALEGTRWLRNLKQTGRTCLVNGIQII